MAAKAAALATKGKGHHTRIDSVAWENVSKDLDMKGNDRLVVVRYFLDRPGYGLHNSAARLWFHPPVRCKPVDVKEFLEKQGIAIPGLLVELYLDKYESFMLLEACEFSCVEWDFEHVTYHEPGILNVRLTDLSEEANMTEVEKSYPQTAPSKARSSQASQPQYANPTSAGLFSFSMMVGLETAALFGSKCNVLREATSCGLWSSIPCATFIAAFPLPEILINGTSRHFVTKLQNWFQELWIHPLPLHMVHTCCL